MNLIHGLYLIKKHFQFNNEQLADYVGISKQELAKIFGGHKGINSQTLKRISQILRISMDELTDNHFVVPFYHFSKHIFSLYKKAEKNYPNYYIEKGDHLYTRPFVDGKDKINQLILYFDTQKSEYEIEKYNGNMKDYLKEGKQIHYHIVGKSSVLYQPFEDVEFQREISTLKDEGQKKRGRPIKTKKL